MPHAELNELYDGFEISEAELELVAGGLRAEWMDNRTRNDGD